VTLLLEEIASVIANNKNKREEEKNKEEQKEMLKSVIRTTLETCGFIGLYMVGETNLFEDEKFMGRFELRKKYIYSQGKALTNENLILNQHVEKVTQQYLNTYLAKNRKIHKDDWGEFLAMMISDEEGQAAIDSLKELEEEMKKQNGNAPNMNVQNTSDSSGKNNNSAESPAANTKETPPKTIGLVSFTPDEFHNIMKFSQLSTQDHPLVLFLSIIQEATTKHEYFNERYAENMELCEKNIEVNYLERMGPQDALEQDGFQTSAKMVGGFAYFYALTALRLKSINVFTSGRPLRAIFTRNNLFLAAFRVGIVLFIIKGYEWMKTEVIPTINWTGPLAQFVFDEELRETLKEEKGLNPPDIAAPSPHHNQKNPLTATPSPLPSPISVDQNNNLQKTPLEKMEEFLTLQQEIGDDMELLDWMTTPTPEPSRWKGATALDPHSPQRGLINCFFRPVSDGFIFFSLFLPYMLKFHSRIVAHSLVLGSYLMTRMFLNEPSLEAVNQKLPPLEAMLSHATTSLFHQLIVTVMGGTMAFPAYLYHSSHEVMVYFKDMLSKLPENPPVEFSLFATVQYSLIVLVSSFFIGIPKEFRQRLSERRSKNGELEVFLSPEKRKEAQETIAKLSKNLIHIFSSDYFEEKDRQSMSHQDIINFIIAFEHYKQKNLPKKSYYSFYIMNPSFSSLFFQPQFYTSIPKKKEFDDKMFYSSVDSFLHKVLSFEYPISESDFSFKKERGPIRAKEFEKIVIRCLKTLDPTVLEKELMKIQIALELHAQGRDRSTDDLFSFCNYFENNNIPKATKVEKLLDIIQEYYMSVLQSDEVVLSFYEPKLFEEFQEKLMGRYLNATNLTQLQPPMKTAREMLITKLHGFLTVGRVRYTTAVLHNHGMTLPYFEYLLKKFSTDSPEIRELLKEWNQYFRITKDDEKDTVTYRKKFQDLLLTNASLSKRHKNDRKFCYTETVLQGFTHVRLLTEVNSK
jgi:hypothetical protein